MGHITCLSINSPENNKSWATAIISWIFKSRGFSIHAFKGYYFFHSIIILFSVKQSVLKILYRNNLFLWIVWPMTFRERDSKLTTISIDRWKKYAPFIMWYNQYKALLWRCQFVIFHIPPISWPIQCVSPPGSSDSLFWTPLG